MIAAGRKVLVAGGASGLGLAAARALADHGAAVAIGDADLEQLAEAGTVDDRLRTLALDVTDRGSVVDGVTAAAESLGGLDTLVYSAGVIHVEPIERVTAAQWDRTLDVNLRGAFLVMQAAAPALRVSGRGRIVAISSDAGRRGYPWLQAYCASKFGLVGLCESLAVELAPDAVTVNCVLPGSCPTTRMGQALVALKSELSGRTPDEVLDAIARSFPLGRYVNETDVVAAILYFVSDAAGFLTGVSLDIDGGEHLGYTPGLDADKPSVSPTRDEGAPCQSSG